VIAQLGERQTEDLKVPGPIPGRNKSAILIQMKKMELNTVNTGSWPKEAILLDVNVKKYCNSYWKMRGNEL
jgi:hypothetical protein